MDNKGKFITFSGIDGVGKSTIITLVSKYLRDQGIEHVLQQEPSAFGRSKHIRKLVKEINFSSQATLCLVNAARIEAIENYIKPALEEGKHVLSHRWLPDSKAYHDYKLATELHNLMCDDFTPDLQIILDAPVPFCKERIKNRESSDPPDRFDLASDEDMEWRRTAFIRQGFEPGFVLIDTSKEIEFVIQEVLEQIKKVIEHI